MPSLTQSFLLWVSSQWFVSLQSLEEKAIEGTACRGCMRPVSRHHALANNATRESSELFVSVFITLIVVRHAA